MQHTYDFLPDEKKEEASTKDLIEMVSHETGITNKGQTPEQINEFGSPEGILTLEDIIETLLGLEIVDEGDEQEDMQEHARRLWKRRAQKMGLDFEVVEKDPK